MLNETILRRNYPRHFQAKKPPILRNCVDQRSDTKNGNASTFFVYNRTSLLFGGLLSLSERISHYNVAVIRRLDRPMHRIDSLSNISDYSSDTLLMFYLHVYSFSDLQSANVSFGYTLTPDHKVQ